MNTEPAALPKIMSTTENSALPVGSDVLFGSWQPIATAPKDGTEILVWHDHKSDIFGDDDGLTAYGAWCEGEVHDKESGMYLAMWGGGFDYDESGEGWGPFTSMPDWWMKSDPTFNPCFPLAPTHWMPLPCQPNVCALAQPTKTSTEETDA